MWSALIVCKAFFGIKRRSETGWQRGVKQLDPSRSDVSPGRNHPHRLDDPHPLDVTDAPQWRHAATSLRRRLLQVRARFQGRTAPRGYRCRSRRASHLFCRLWSEAGRGEEGRGGISREQLITEAAAGVDSLITATVLVNVRILTNVHAPVC